VPGVFVSLTRTLMPRATSYPTFNSGNIAVAVRSAVSLHAITEFCVSCAFEVFMTEFISEFGYFSGYFVSADLFRLRRVAILLKRS